MHSEMCSFHFKSELIVTPRIFTLFDTDSSLPFITIVGKLWVFLLKSMRISLHLSAFSSILFSIDHASTAETALCTSLVKPRGVVWAIVVSSTYFQVSASTSRSLIINKNNQGPSLVPCFTPAGTRPHSDRQSDDSLTRCFLSDRKSSTQTRTLRGMSRASIFLANRLW